VPEECDVRGLKTVNGIAGAPAAGRARVTRACVAPGSETAKAIHYCLASTSADSSRTRALYVG
jgi:hypothetical protein